MKAKDITKIATEIQTDESPWDPDASPQTNPTWPVPQQMVMQVIDKLDQGVYKTEPTVCLCGIEPANDTFLTNFDRYSIPHRMVLCEHCLLVRANPRMTTESYREFYNNEYRLIYDGFMYKEKMLDREFMFSRSLKTANIIHGIITEFDVHPKVVIEIGCDQGANMWPWMQEGAKAYGIDICTASHDFARSKGITMFSSLDEAIASGVKADLLIASDLIEHLTDFSEVSRWKDLLAPDGFLWVYTPGILATRPSELFQNAHTYQFIGVTLDYYLRRLGYIPVAQDDRCVYLGRYQGNAALAFLLPPQLQWRKYIFEQLQQAEKRSVPPIWTQCKFNENETLANMKVNLTRRIPALETVMGVHRGESAMILAGGPSIDGQLDKIRELQAQGVKTFVIERMYPWATKTGVKVDYAVVLDASDGVEAGLTDIQPEATHLLIASGNPRTFEVLEPYKKVIFSGVMGMTPRAADLWKENGYTKLTVVNTGGSVALASMYLALIMGFRRLHVFGFDCMVQTPRKDYSAHVAGESVPREYFEVEIDGKVLLTCSPFLAFAQQFFEMMETARRWGMIDSIDVYGDSLVNYMFQGDDNPTVLMSTHPTLPPEGVNHGE